MTRASQVADLDIEPGGPRAREEEEFEAIRDRFIMFHQASFGFGVALAWFAGMTPAFFSYETMIVVLWGVTALALLAALVQVAMFAYYRRLKAEAEEGPVLERPAPSRLDFDQPWKETEGFEES